MQLVGKAEEKQLVSVGVHWTVHRKRLGLGWEFETREQARGKCGSELGSQLTPR